MKLFPLFCLVFVLLFSVPLPAAEFTEGPLRLLLHPRSGRFSLYLVSNDSRRPQPLFFDQDPRTSFLSVIADNRSFKMGDTSAFMTRIAGDARNPSFIFESSFMTVTQEFSFVGNPFQRGANGVRITFTIENISDNPISAGARFLLDTNLSDTSSRVEFLTNQRIINSETLITRYEGDRFWVDRSGQISLAGSINTGSAESPDSVHFANWERLNGVSWKVPYQTGRNFNLPPFSVRDSAVCYYFEPLTLNPGRKRSFGFTLALDGEAIYSMLPVSSREFAERLRDLAVLRELMAQINNHLIYGDAAEEELSRLEISLDNLRAKYNLRHIP